MNVTHEINLDFVRHESRKQVCAVQGDRGSRVIELCLFAGGEPWPVPGGVEALLRYSKMDGTGGEYDTMPDGSPAWSAEGNKMVWKLAPQVLACPGTVICHLVLLQGEKCLSTFSFDILVEPDDVEDVEKSEGYFNWSRRFIPVFRADPGQVIRVKAVDGEGIPTEWEGAQLPQVPGALPNPNKLRFTGAVNAEYDGTEAVSVEIPKPGRDFSLYGLGTADNPLLIPSDYALADMKNSGWYSIELGYGTVDFGDGFTANKFLLRVESGASEQYTSVTKQTAIFASYPGAEEYFRYCKNGYDWTQWQSAKQSGGVSRVLLWENADTISEFSAQTIQLNDLSGFDAIEVIYAAGGYPGGYGSCYMSSGVLPKITGAMDTDYYTDGYALQSVANAYYPDVWRYYRPLNWETNRIAFMDCTAVGTYGDSETDNYYCTPVRIYGIKGVESL